MFNKCKVNEKIGLGEYLVSKCEVPDREEGDEENVRKWKEERAAKDDSVFVLWVEWVNGVACWDSDFELFARQRKVPSHRF